MPNFKKNKSKFQMSGWWGWQQGNAKPPFKFLGKLLGGAVGAIGSKLFGTQQGQSPEQMARMERQQNIMNFRNNPANMGGTFDTSSFSKKRQTNTSERSFKRNKKRSSRKTMDEIYRGESGHSNWTGW